jgi:glucose-6-phosphate isomerase
MIYTPTEEPFVTPIEASTGFAPGFLEHYSKNSSSVMEVYQAQPEVLGDGQSAVAYEVFSSVRSALPGALTVGTSVLNPGLFGKEFAMTRGHIHEISNRAEIYYCLSGSGLMLLESLSGEFHALEMEVCSLVYVPGGWIHRTVNVGSVPMVSLFCYDSDAGQDYNILERSGGMRKIVVDDGGGGWALQNNPRYVPRGEK